jgi:rSAM/selenodomain-associated transferase 2
MAPMMPGPADTSPPGRAPGGHVAVVIPVLGDLPALSRLVTALQAQGPAELVVVSGRKDSDTAAFCRERGCTYLETSANRGAQLDAGARAAEAPVIWFLHADVEVAPDALAAIQRAIAAGADSGCFRFAFQGPPTWYKRLLETLVALRIRLGGIAYGDQGLFAQRDAYFACGGFALQPLFEEVQLVKRFRSRGSFRSLEQPIRVSTRRWERDGWCYRTLHNRWLALRFALGGSPQALAASYRRLVRSGQEPEP